MIFKYKISTQNGKIEKGEAEAVDQETLINKFRRDGYFILSIKEKKRNNQFLLNLTKVGDLEKVYLVKNFSLMIKAGLPLSEIINTLLDQAKSQKLRKILNEIKTKTDQGISLAEAFSLYPETFSPIFLGLIKLGEETGQLEETTRHLHSLLLSQYDFKKRTKSALFYPLAVIIVSLVVFISIFLFLFPRLADLFSSLDVQPPLITRILISLTAFFHNNIIIASIVLLALIFAGWFFSRKNATKRFLEKIYFSLPIIGRIIKKINLSYFAKNQCLLLNSGMPIEKALMLNTEITENEIYRTKIIKTLEGIRKGETISSNLDKYPKQFPKNFSKVVQSGEKSGNLIESFSFLSSFYEAEVERETRDLSTALEPILLLGVGLIVAFIAVAVIMPIYQYITAIQAMN